MDAPKLLLFIQCCTFLSTVINACSVCDESNGNGDGAKFEINPNGCKFQRSNTVIFLAQVFFVSSDLAMIQVDCVKDGDHIYSNSFCVKNRKRIEFNSAGIDLNGANCSLTGCYESDASNPFTIPHQSCVIDFDECLPEYCPENVSTCDAVTAPHGSYTCTCNQTYQEFNYTTKECNCMSGYRESEDGTYCEYIDVAVESPGMHQIALKARIIISILVLVAVVMPIVIVIGTVLVMHKVMQRRRRLRDEICTHGPKHTWGASYDDNLSLDDVTAPVTPLEILPSLNNSLHFLDCDSSTDEDTVFTAQTNPSEMNSVNSNTNPVSRMMDHEEENNVELSGTSTVTHNSFTSSLTRSSPSNLTSTAGGLPIQEQSIAHDGNENLRWSGQAYQVGSGGYVTLPAQVQRLS